MKLKYVKTTLASLVLALSIVVNGIVSAQTYTVKSGDTLSELAVKFSSTVEELAVKNNIKDANLILIGQVLEIGQSSLQLTEEPAEVVEETPAEAPAAPVEEPTQEPQAAAPAPAAPSTGLTDSEAAAKEEIAQRESGGSYTARNGQYYGRYQLTESYLNGDLSPENQERVADAYVAGRYGSWVAALAFWNANGWY